MAALATASAHGAQQPERWNGDDTAPIAATRYTVEVGTFRSRRLAEPVAHTLRELQWSPVIIEESPGAVRVRIGDTRSIADAFAAREILAAEEVADGTITALSPAVTGVAPGLSGPFPDPFRTASTANAFGARLQDITTSARNLGNMLTATEREALDEILVRAAQGSSDRTDYTEAFIPLLRVLHHGDGDGVLRLALAEPIARGEFGGALEHRAEAMTICFQVHYGVRGDWVRGHAAVRAMLSMDHLAPRWRATAILEEQALVAHIFAHGVQPAPSLASIRSRLAEAMQLAPETERRLLARMELLYLQSLAWEGRWDRVEDVAQEMMKRHEGLRGYSAAAAYWYARSMERSRNYPRAIRTLQAIERQVIAQEEGVRVGARVLDLRGMARDWIAYFQELEGGRTPPARPIDYRVTLLTTAVSNRAPAAPAP